MIMTKRREEIEAVKVPGEVYQELLLENLQEIGHQEES